MPSHKRYEEDIISPTIEKYLINKGYKTKKEFTLVLKDFNLLNGKQKPRIRFDIIASNKNKIILVESKAAVYSQLIGICIGELQAYKVLFDTHFNLIKESLQNLSLSQEKKVDLYCAFPDIKPFNIG